MKCQPVMFLYFKILSRSIEKKNHLNNAEVPELL